MQLRESVLDIARNYMQKEKEHRELAQRLRFNLGKVQYKDALEPNLIYKISKKDASTSFAAIDGGIACEEFHGLDIIISRSLAAKFEYKEGKLCAHQYYPSHRPEFGINAKSGLEQFDKLRYISLIRLRSELECAIGCLKKWDLGYLILDGSIAPLLADKPPSDSQMNEDYMQIVGLYQKLYSLCAEKNTYLIGISKDSRGKRFIDMLADIAGEAAPSFANTTDTVFLDHLLQEGERTFAFKYSSAPTKNPVLSDLGQWASKINTFYIKPIAGDRPLRVEFLSNSGTFDDIASTIAGICSFHPHYAYPAVLIEADLRAAIDPNEVVHTIADLRMRLGQRGAMPLRRNSRPFR